MHFATRNILFAWLVFSLSNSGCVLLPESPRNDLPSALLVEKSTAPTAQSSPLAGQPSINAASPEETGAPGKTPAFLNLKQLTPEELVREVLNRNPTLAAMTAATEAAKARFPQVISLDDPNLAAWMAPGSFGSNQVNPALRFEFSQKIPARGKRQLRGEMAQAEAGIAEQELESAKLELIEESRYAFLDLYLVERNIEVNDETLKLLNDFRQNAETRYRNGQAPQQDVLQAEVEIGLLKEKAIINYRVRKVARARINTLLHLEPDLPLPAPLKELEFSKESRSSGSLRQEAGNQRPDLKGLKEKIRLDEAALQLARREFSPDYETMAAYDSFWQGMDKQLQFQLGVKLNLPARRDRRFAAVSEAQYRLAQKKAEFNLLEDKINFQVQEAYEQIMESEQILNLFKTVTLPAASANVREAQATYINGKIPFLTLIAAQKEQTMARERYFLSQAEALRRKAALSRVIAASAAQLP